MSSGGHVEAAEQTMLLHGCTTSACEDDVHLLHRDVITGNVLLGGPTFQRDRVAAKLGV